MPRSRLPQIPKDKTLRQPTVFEAFGQNLESYPVLLTGSEQTVELFKIGRTNPYWVAFKFNHYVPNPDVIGRQEHYLIIYKNHIVGAISGSMSIFANSDRDAFFAECSQDQLLNNIVNNIFFRLDISIKNLGTQVLKLWRIQCAKDWEKDYGLKVVGYETFVEPPRSGAVYKADNWRYLGLTKGAVKSRKGLKLYGENIGDLFTKGTKKHIFCIKTGVTLGHTEGHKHCERCETGLEQSDADDHAESTKDAVPLPLVWTGE